MAVADLPATARPAGARRGWRVKDRRNGYGFVAPQVLGLLVFTVVPFAVALAPAGDRKSVV